MKHYKLLRFQFAQLASHLCCTVLTQTRFMDLFFFVSKFTYEINTYICKSHKSRPAQHWGMRIEMEVALQLLWSVYFGYLHMKYYITLTIH